MEFLKKSEHKNAVGRGLPLPCRAVFILRRITAHSHCMKIGCRGDLWSPALPNRDFANSPSHGRALTSFCAGDRRSPLQVSFGAKKREGLAPPVQNQFEINLYEANSYRSANSPFCLLCANLAVGATCGRPRRRALACRQSPANRASSQCLLGGRPKCLDL